jgi:uroporphyrin-III C-methyltransferase
MRNQHTKSLISRHGDRRSTRPTRPRIPAACNSAREVSLWLQSQLGGVAVQCISEREAERRLPLLCEEAIPSRVPKQVRPAPAILLPARISPCPLPRELQILALLSPADCSGRAKQGGDLGGHYAVIGAQGAPEMIAAFSALDVRREYGTVWLVGFGPGDPSLMTLKANRVLHAADSILYDDLIDRSVLSRYRARSIYAGKRKGRSQGRQAVINRMLHRAAVRGETVVRLKGGDPLVFARGGEEIEYLQKRFVAVRVVPGVTSALAAAADLQHPLTRRGVSSRLTIAAGHASGSGKPTESDDTLVYYMASSRLAQLAEELAQAGFDPELPAAVVEKASLPDRSCRVTTIGGLKNLASRGPAVLIVGNNLGSAGEAPTLLYTGISPYRFRGPEQLVHYPLIARSTKRQPAAHRSVRRRHALLPVDQPRIDLGPFQGVVFTHEPAVDQFRRIWGSLPELAYATNRAVYRRLIQEGGKTTVIPAF